MNKVIRSLTVTAGAVAALMSFGAAAQASAGTSTIMAAKVSCNAPGTGNTTVWGNCKNTGTTAGKASLVYWCVNAIGGGSKQYSTTKSVPAGKTVKFVGECTFKARNPYFKIG
ncbi:hypothetical protein [Streptosporangium sp. V21-05]|uniref:hypothetical protein n=1 Tax=Streptosporangium sp. V21-05 TaxID=3446115 RepID=UPI003F539558